MKGLRQAQIYHVPISLWIAYFDRLFDNKDGYVLKTFTNEPK